jgi:hypothetical protein
VDNVDNSDMVKTGAHPDPKGDRSSCTVSIWLLLAAAMVFGARWLVGWWFVTPRRGGFGNTFYQLEPWLYAAVTKLRGYYQVKYYVIAIGLALAGAVLCSLARSRGRPPRPWQGLRTRAHVGIICLLVSVPLILCSYEASRPAYGMVMFGANAGTSYKAPGSVVHGMYVVRRVPLEAMPKSSAERQKVAHVISLRTAEATTFSVIAAGLIVAGGILIWKSRG